MSNNKARAHLIQKNSLTRTPAWMALAAHQTDMAGVHMRDLHRDDPARFDKFHIKHEGILFDYSKHIITDETKRLLMALARAQNIEALRDDMFAGVAINTSQNRSVLHGAARGSCDDSVHVDGQNTNAFIRDLQAQMRDLSDDIRANANVTDVVNIGIGGSDIGPYMVCKTLAAGADGPRIHFVSNIDGDDLSQKLNRLTPENTVFIVASKTFTTLETMENAAVAKKWADGRSRFIAVSGNANAAHNFGVARSDVLPLPDWVGGRFSVWSGIGLSICLSLGFNAFKELLRGAHSMDEHFKTAPLEENMPVIMGVLGVWYQNFWNFVAHGVLPYAQNLRHFPRYVCQIDMESNGKHVTRDGQFVDYATGPLVFGGTGTSAQHAFFQALHQGTDIIPCDFIASVTADHDLGGHHKHLLANALAQSQALMMGQDNAGEPHKHFNGNRPSSTILVERVDAYHLGMLMALYEHKVCVQGAIWNINSFDQWGVELGKILAKDIVNALSDKTLSTFADHSTAGLMRHIRKAHGE